MARILKVCAKTVDRFTATLEEDGKETADYEGYVPKFFPEDHYGDYVELDIDSMWLVSHAKTNLSALYYFYNIRIN
jgi:hypothetical protein